MSGLESIARLRGTALPVNDVAWHEAIDNTRNAAARSPLVLFGLSMCIFALLLLTLWVASGLMSAIVPPPAAELRQLDALKDRSSKIQVPYGAGALVQQEQAAAEAARTKAAKAAKAAKARPTAAAGAAPAAPAPKG